jgi:deoxyribonuclease-4
LRAQSLAALIDELDRAEALGLRGVVIHPGTCTSGTEADALRLVAQMILEAFRQRPHGAPLLLLEGTAGQGRTVGHRFEQLATILDHLDGSPRVGVCLDTCHLIASGYDIISAEGYADTFTHFDRVVGLSRLAAFHGNDSKKPCGSRVDRHEHVGQGCLGLEPFRRILNDPRFAGLSMMIETEKSPSRGKAGTVTLDPLDVRNLEILRSLRHRGTEFSAPSR